MTEAEIKAIFRAFAADDTIIDAAPFGGGHINDTYKITGKRGAYTLQRINGSVFADPPRVMENILRITRHISEKLIMSGCDPSRGTLRVIRSAEGKPYVFYNGEYYRMYHFIDGVKASGGSPSPEDMYRAALAFGRFQRMLSDFPAELLYETIPDFHNTQGRFEALLNAAARDTSGRALSVSDEIRGYSEYAGIYGVVTRAIENGSVPIRVTHNDTKPDNILFDAVTKDAVCIIDLDTVMPGSLLYDYGDALRCGMNPAPEDAANTEDIYARMDIFRAYTRGYIEAVGELLTDGEKELLSVAPRLLTLECGMRFLTDYICGDVYFKTTSEHQNLYRARAQLALAADMERHEEEMRSFISGLI